MSKPQILVVDCGSEKVGLIEQAVSEFGFEPWRVQLAKLAQASSADISGIIVSGSPILFTETEYSGYLKSLEFTRFGRVPALGICFGHQIFGLLHGAKVFKGPDCRTDMAVEVLEKDTLFKGLESRLSLQEDHCEGISLPPDFVVLARSEKYEVEAMAHRNRPLFGVQFHPEASGTTGRNILGNFLSLCRKD